MSWNWERIQKHLFSDAATKRVAGDVYERLFVPHGYHYCEFSESSIVNFEGSWSAGPVVGKEG